MVPVPTLLAISGMMSIIQLYRSNRKLRRKNAHLADVLTMQTEWATYLVDVIDRHGVELSEFDMIVIDHTAKEFNNLTEGP